MVFQVEVTDSLLDDGLDFMGADALDKCVELECLFNGHHGEDGVILGAVPDQLPCILELLLDVVALNRDLTRRWCYFTSQTLESCGLSSTINSKKREAFTEVEAERRLFDGSDGRTAESVVFFLEVGHSDAINVIRVILLVILIA